MIFASDGLSKLDTMTAVFDSGAGGLSVLKELMKLLPDEHYLYYSDSANCPYGDKSREEVTARGFAITEFLLSKGAGMIVVACNTATAAAIGSLRARWPEIPFVGIEPAVKPAALNSKSGVIGVLATAGTLKGSNYLDLREHCTDRGVKVVEQVGRGFVELVENGVLDGPEAEAVVRKALVPLIEAGADSIVLGCTHYPFLEATIAKVAAEIATGSASGQQSDGKALHSGNHVPGIRIINPAPAVAAQAARLYRGLHSGTQSASAASDGSGSLAAMPTDSLSNVELFTSGDPDVFRRLASRLLATRIASCW